MSTTAVTRDNGRRLTNERAIMSRRDERRFYDLAAAVRDHERNSRAAGARLTAQDDALYRRLRQICGE